MAPDALPTKGAPICPMICGWECYCQRAAVADLLRFAEGPFPSGKAGQPLDLPDNTATALHGGVVFPEDP